MKTVISRDFLTLGVNGLKKQHRGEHGRCQGGPVFYGPHGPRRERSTKLRSAADAESHARTVLPPREDVLGTITRVT